MRWLVEQLILVPTLENELRAVGIKPIHSFTQRVSEDRVMEDGTIQKSRKAIQHIKVVLPFIFVG